MKGTQKYFEIEFRENCFKHFTQLFYLLNKELVGPSKFLQFKMI